MAGLAVLESAGHLPMRRRPTPGCSETPAVGGWTLNFAHRSAWLVLLGSIVIAVGPLLVILITRRVSGTTVFGAIAGSVVVLSLLSAWESERQR